MTVTASHTFDWPRPPLTANQRMHHMQRARITRDVRSAAAYAFRTFPEVGRVRVELEWVVTTSHRRDVDNIVPTLKAVCDGLVDVEIVPDDTPQFMEKVMPTIRRGEKAGVTVHVTEIT